MEFSPPVPSEIAPVFMIILIIFITLMGLIVTAIKVLIFCKIFSRAGYSWALGLLMLVPIANIIMPFVLAFGDWPILKELRSLKHQH
ncbi:MAG: hypothetical protein JW837_10555 [Sedimentisphaerales bacterium]|nr:hypothetical protein [Sedimentisphaerales bacterium]